MTTYHSSDWHLGHVRILELCDRPFKSVHHMNYSIIERCNDIVTERDTLVLHGDDVMGQYFENIKLFQLVRAGKIVLIPGNHDRFSLAFKGTDASRREAAHTLKQVIGERVRVLIDKKPSSWEREINGHQVLLSHYPYRGDHTQKDRHLEMRPVDEGLPLIHGHVHGKWRENGRMLNVGVDVWDFAPVSQHAITLWLEGLPSQPQPDTMVSTNDT
jgi:calcineurin-like phosphoesterase family protein